MAKRASDCHFAFIPNDFSFQGQGLSQRLKETAVLTKGSGANRALAYARASENMAERVGFEPTVGVNPLRFSRPVH